MQFNLKKLGQIFLNLTFQNVLIKTFPKMYDTCRGLFFRPRIPSGAWCFEKVFNLSKARNGERGQPEHGLGVWDGLNPNSTEKCETFNFFGIQTFNVGDKSVEIFITAKVVLKKCMKS